MTARFRLTLAIVLAAGVAAPAQVAQSPQARDSRVAAAGPGQISGVVVTDEDVPRPVKRAEVRALVAGNQPRTAYTDASGAFTFANLPMGRYSVEVSKPGYVRAAYGARRHDRPGTPITLTEAQRTQTIQMRMPRGGVITGRIVDEYGQPAQGARVRAQLARVVNGERVLSEVPLPGAILGEPADDRGVYRLYGLPAGEYVISVVPRNQGIGDIRRMTEQEIRSAEQAIRQPQSPLEPDTPPITLGYATMYYPGVFAAAQASTIALKAGEERQGVDIAVQFVRTANVEGTVNTPGGVRPEAVELTLLPRLQIGAPFGGGGVAVFVSGPNRQRIGPDGKFTFTGVTPGAYTLSARYSQEGGQTLWGDADIDVDGQLVSGVALSLQEGLTISGRLAFEADGVDPPTLFSRARLNLMPAEGGLMIGRAQAAVSSTGTFTIRGVIPGRYRVNANFNTPEANWTLKSAMIKGKDALDLIVDIAPGDVIGDAVFTFTNKTQELSGTIQDAAKRPAPDFTVVLFPADKALWSSARRLRSTRPDTNGRFMFGNVPAGSYRIAAVMDIGQEDLRDQTLLEELFAASIGVMIADGEKKTQDIRLASGG